MSDYEHISSLVKPISQDAPKPSKDLFDKHESPSTMEYY